MAVVEGLWLQLRICRTPKEFVAIATAVLAVFGRPESDAIRSQKSRLGKVFSGRDHAEVLPATVLSLQANHEVSFVDILEVALEHLKSDRSCHIYRECLAG